MLLRSRCYKRNTGLTRCEDADVDAGQRAHAPENDALVGGTGREDLASATELHCGQTVSPTTHDHAQQRLRAPAVTLDV